MNVSENSTGNSSSSSTTAAAPTDGTKTSLLEDFLGPSAKDRDFFLTVVVVFNILVCVEFAIGSVGNTIAFAVLLRKSFRKSSTTVYLRALAVFDFVVLLVNFLLIFNQKNPRMGKTYCVTIDYITIVCINCSNWTLILVTAERLLAILLPHRVNQIMTHKVAYISLTVLLVAMMILDSNDLIFINQSEWIFCQPTYTTKHANEVMRGLGVLHLFKFLIIPIPFITISNILIITHLRRRGKFFQSTANPNTTGKEVKNKQGATETPNQQQTVTVQQVSEAQNIRNKRQRGLTVTLVALNSLFLITRVPFEIYNIYLGYPVPKILPLKLSAIKFLIGNLSLANNTFNVFLYFLVGSRFKQEFKAMVMEIFCCFKLKR